MYTINTYQCGFFNCIPSMIYNKPIRQQRGGEISPKSSIKMDFHYLCVGVNRAVGAGPAGPAAAGPIVGQLTRVKMPYELRQVV